MESKGVSLFSQLGLISQYLPTRFHSDSQKAIFLAPQNYPQLDGTAPKKKKTWASSGAMELKRNNIPVQGMVRVYIFSTIIHKYAH